MKRTWVIIGALAVLVVGGLAVWMQFGAKQQPNDTTRVGDSQNTTSDAVDRTDSTIVAIAMKNTAFTPQKIQVKKGTIVRWVNEDDIRHNVVALNENDQSGLPAQNELFGKGGTYEFTFDLIGTFDYKCTPHPFMTGSVEVVE